MGIIAWIIFGLIAGAIAKLIMPGKDPGGIIVTIVIGILGAVLGGFIATALGMGTVSGFNLGSFVIAILGAILLLWLYRVVKSR
ncbi:transglycosylase-associated protein [Salinisphaera shabanensis T35B1]|uniref:GlsB/YeaQ/YmgE family stress response membrane protein n=1 Tax=Salinisphaera shabanensis TaxID=180542 RepID=UPI00334103E8